MKPLIEQHLISGEKHFRWRGGEITRLEAFTDAVFAFAVTLLVVSLEVPRNFSELAQAMKGFVAFAICFAILVHLWYQHYVFSRRYGLQTFYTVALNSILLFVVLFYVYPLKFLFSLVIGEFSDGRLAVHPVSEAIQPVQIPILMVIYSLGFSAVAAVYWLLYRYAYRLRKELDLNEYECLSTRREAYNQLAMVILGLIVGATALLLPVNVAGLAGYLYGLIGVYYWLAGWSFGKKETQALERVQAQSSRSLST